MAMYVGDFKAVGSDVHIGFSTNDRDGGSITYVGGTGSNLGIYVYRDSSYTNESTAGVFTQRNFDSFTGMHLVRILFGIDPDFYLAGHDYMVVLRDVTIDGENINAILGMFSIENRFVEVDVTKLAGNTIQQTAGHIHALDDAGAALATVAKILAATGVTVGGAWTWAKVLKITAAWAAGNWRMKATDSTVQQLMDAENGTTVILEQTLTRSPVAGSDYRTITVKI